MATVTEKTHGHGPFEGNGTYPPHPEGVIGGSHDLRTIGDKIATVVTAPKSGEKTS